MKKFAAFFAAAVLAVTLGACINKSSVSEELTETASITTGISDL